MTPERRFDHVAYEDADGELKELYDDTMKVLGVPFVLNWFKCQAASFELLRGNWTKIKTTLFSGDIPMLLKQLIIYSISKERGCKYCAFIHGTTADSLGAELCSDDGFRISENIAGNYIPSSYKTAIRIVTRCALDPNSTTDADFEELRDEGFSDQEIQELMAQADLANMLNTISDIAGIEIDSEFLNM